MATRTRILTALVLTMAISSGPIADGRDQAATAIPPTSGAETVPETESDRTSPRQQAAAAAAADLFADAGLTLPEIEIHFHGSLEPCAGRNGFHRYEGGSSRVDICMPDDRPDVFLTQLIVHEFAHAWERHTLTDRTRRAFMDLRGLDSWDSQDAEWKLRGSEHAAEIITWGVFDRPMPVITLPDTGCDALQTGFLLLTDMGPNRAEDELCVHWYQFRDEAPASNPAV